MLGSKLKLLFKDLDQKHVRVFVVFFICLINSILGKNVTHNITVCVHSVPSGGQKRSSPFPKCVAELCVAVTVCASLVCLCQCKRVCARPQTEAG